MPRLEMPEMKDKFFAVIDTNVIVSALISKNLDSNPGKVFRAIVQERIIPLFNDEILAEYRCVLSRPKFHLAPALIETVLKAIIVDGIVTHFPILLAIPGADIIQFDGRGMRYVDYEDTESHRITKMFINHREMMVESLTGGM